MKKIIIAIVVILIIITMANLQDIQNQLDDLREQVEQNTSEVNTPTLEYPITFDNKEVFNDTLKGEILDKTWSEVISYLTFFESMDGLTVTEGTVGNASLDGTSLSMSTDASSNDTTEVLKQPSWQGILTFAEPSRFRTTVIINDGGGSIANQESYFIVGSIGSESYGFKLDGTTLYGVTHDGSTENTVDTGVAVAGSTSYNLEARYKPNEKVLFIVDGLERATSTSNLPTADLSVNTKLFNIQITTEENTVKTLSTSYFQYIQSKYNLDS